MLEDYLAFRKNHSGLPSKVLRTTMPGGSVLVQLQFSDNASYSFHVYSTEISVTAHYHYLHFDITPEIMVIEFWSSDNGNKRRCIFKTE